jgi:hypothetical protein
MQVALAWLLQRSAEMPEMGADIGWAMLFGQIAKAYGE